MADRPPTISVPKIASQAGNSSLYETLRDLAAHVSAFVNEQIANVTAAIEALTASDIAFTPTGGVASTDVQSAVAELDTEKVGGSGTTGALLKWTASATAGDSIVTESSGKLGVNNASPSGIVHPVTTSTAQPFAGESVGTTVSPFVICYRARGTTGSKTAIQTGDYIGGIQAQGYNGTVYQSTTGAAVAAIATENWSSTNNGCDIVFVVTTTGTATAIEGFRVKNNGAIQIKGGAQIFSNSGSPEGVVTGNIGDMYLRKTDGGAGTTLYVKESGAGTNTGWIGK